MPPLEIASARNPCSRLSRLHSWIGERTALHPTLDQKTAYYVFMRRLAAVALLVIGFALPVCAQHGASRGGFSGRSAPAFRGGFSRSAPSRFTASPGSSRRSSSAARGLQRGAAGSFIARPPYTGSRRTRNPYRPSYGAGVRYGVPVYGLSGLIGPYSVAYPYDMGYDDSAASPSSAPAGPDGPYGYDAESAPQEQPPPRMPYPPPSDQAQPSPAPESAEAVTLVFKDGRPSEQIHNYVLTRTTLYVRDQRPRDIPTDQLDLAATAKVNQAEGVDFQLPSTLK